MTRLLVSVRSPAEAETALAGGADWIDIKEPSRGTLGRADDAVIAAIVQQVAGRAPVSAALGELTEGPRLPPGFSGLVKLGLAGCPVLDERLCSSSPSVLAAYADWQRAAAPSPSAVLDFAITHRLPALLIDTWKKDGRTLLDWATVSELVEYRTACREHRLLYVLAGSLGDREIERLLPLEPDLIAVRGPACRDRNRSATIDLEAVQRLATFVHGTARKLTTRATGTRSTACGNHGSTTPAFARSSQLAP